MIFFFKKGTCLGFQETGILAAKDDSVLKTGFDSGSTYKLFTKL